MAPKNRSGKSKKTPSHASSNGSTTAATTKANAASASSKVTLRESYRMATGTLISQPRALDVKIGGFTLQSYGKVLINETEIELTIGRRYGLIGANGSGKCWGKGTMMRMEDGTIKAIEDIKKGDKLINDEGKQTTVGKTIRGRDTMFEIEATGKTETTQNTQQQLYKTWKCNQHHILVVKVDKQCGEIKYCDQKNIYTVEANEVNDAKKTIQRVEFNCGKDYQQAIEYQTTLDTQHEVWELSVAEYMQLTEREKKALRLFRAGAIEYNAQNGSLDMHVQRITGRKMDENGIRDVAWAIGVWLINGIEDRPSIECSLKHQGELAKRLRTVRDALDGGENIYSDNTLATDAYADVNMGDRFRSLLLHYSILSNQHFSLSLQTESIAVRHAILSGMVDASVARTVCSKKRFHSDFNIVASQRALIDGAISAARSLGITVQHLYRDSFIASNGENQNVYFLSLSDLALDHRWYGESFSFTVSPVGIGDYYGFMLDGNGRCLLADYTVSHNSTFLRALGAREVPIPNHIDIHLLENEADPSDLNAIDWVIGEAREEMQKLEKQVEDLLDSGEVDADSDLVLDIYQRLDDMDPDTFEVRAARLLTGLGFDQVMMKKRTRDMSGGWRMRVALAKALFIRPTLLLLDEPTNHLDLEACVWLEEYLSHYDRCLVVVSHSQDFLNGVCTNIVHLTPKKDFVYYGGNYDTFVQTKQELEVNQMKAFEKEQADIAKIKQFVSSAGTYANLVRQAKSKLKIIEKMEEKGLTEKVEKEHVFKFHFPDVERLAPPVLMFENVSFAYSGKQEDCLYRNVSFGVDMDSRVALVGPNGAGKSTLLKLMLGELIPTDGQVRRHLHLQFARYNQHSNEILDPSMSALQFIPTQFPDRELEETGWRQLIGKHGVSGPLQTTPIGQLSDGMKTRIVFCLLSLQKPHILLLDEPTNHMDMDTIDSLAEAILTFKGGLVLVSHDFRLLSQVARDIWVCDNKSITPWTHGGIKGYKHSLVKKMHQEEAEYQRQIKAAHETK